MACNYDGVLAMADKARKLGYRPRIISLKASGEAKNLLWPLVKKVGKKQALIIAGETTVRIKGGGKGGRNQETCLAVLARALKKKNILKNILTSSFASDGYDNTNFAGALTDEISLRKAVALKLSPVKYLRRNDSYNFFKKTGDFLLVKREGFNVSDLMIVLKR